MPKEAREKAKSELNKLKLMSPMSAEATVVRNYIDWLVKVPVEEAHQGQARPRRRREGARTRTTTGSRRSRNASSSTSPCSSACRQIKGPILCLVGPPGVGKTSLGQSIARATNRKFVRMSLGGVRDEAEIRGHRRTYIGSMPGKIVQNMAQDRRAAIRCSCSTKSTRCRWISAATRPRRCSRCSTRSRTHTFNDHYLEVDFDLSEVMFVCTANSLNIPAPLLDRMEVIRLPGLHRGREAQHRAALPAAEADQGRTASRPASSRSRDAAILDIIRYYTREAGVRNLERELAKICRKAVKELLLEKDRKARSR